MGIRRLAGTMVILSAVLACFVNPYWIILTLFVGINLLQSSFTKWCLAEDIFSWFGVER